MMMVCLCVRACVVLLLQREEQQRKKVTTTTTRRRIIFVVFVFSSIDSSKRKKEERKKERKNYLYMSSIVSRVLLFSPIATKTATATTLKRISSLSSPASRRAPENTHRIKRTRPMASSTNDEQLNAQEAILKGMQDSTEPTIFDKIVSKDIPATVLYEDNLAMAFKDVNPVAKTHFLVIPKIKAGLSQLSKATEDHKMLLGHCMYVAQMVAKQENLEKGFRVVINDGVDGCQSVYHLHLHVIGGQQLSWPPGC